MQSSCGGFQRRRSRITIGWPKPIGTALGTTMSPKTTRRSWMRLRAIPPIPFLIWVVGPAETYATSDHWATTSWAWTDRRNSVAMARSYSECEVLQQDFLAMKLPESRFDGIFANASLFHVPSQELPRVLAEL